MVDVSAGFDGEMLWYVLKVQTNRERSIRDSLLRKIRLEGLEEYFGETGFDGTFTGPYHTDWQNLLSGEVRLTRRGTGDFQGLATVGVGLSENFGLIINESGLIHGPRGRP